MSLLTDEELLLELERRFQQNKKSLIEVQKLAEELRLLNKKLEESESLKGHFISNITNEIINPFAAIIGLSRNILSSKTQDWDKVRAMVTLIHSEAFYLDFQLKNIFAAAKIEAGEIFPEIYKVDIYVLIQGVIDSFKHETEKKNLEIIMDFDISPGIEKTYYFKTDPELLKLILMNLILNGINYSQESSKIIVKTWMENMMLQISVKDSGVGIAEENHEIIFDRFTRLDSTINSLNKGHGLGLSINKALVELLNGKIRVNSKPNQGATFIVSIPEYNDSNNQEDYNIDENDFLFKDEHKEIF